MKHLLLLLTGIIVINFCTKAQYVPIPDVHLRNFLVQQYPASFSGSLMDTSSAAIVNETTLVLPDSVSNWDGFQYFDNLQSATFDGPINSLPALRNGLTHLTIKYTSFTSLPALPVSLTYFESSNNYVLQSLPALPALLDTLIVSKYSATTPIGALTGLPALPNSLRYLSIGPNQVSSLPALPTGLRYLNITLNPLSSLPALPDSLKKLLCYRDSNLTSLPTLPATLELLSVAVCNITSLPALPLTLTELGVGMTGITSLPPLPPGLVVLDVYNNHITTLPPLPESLINLRIDYNELTTLPNPLPQNIKFFTCGHNQISVMPPIPASVRQMNCEYNLLTSLPPLPDSLHIINCSANQLTSFPGFPLVAGGTTHSTQIRIEFNNITCLPHLPSYNLLLFVDDQLACLPNKPALTTLTVYHQHLSLYDTYPSGEPYPLCNTLNNPNQCPSFPITEGRVYNDINNNLVRDTFEPYRKHVKVQLDNADYTFTNSNGYYQIAVSDTGNFTTTIVPPVYYTAVPMQYNYHFGAYDTLVTNDFALHATVLFDSVNVFINPIVAARPGFAFSYNVCYENPGTVSFPATVILRYDNSLLTYDSASNPAVSHSGNSLTLVDPYLAAGESGCFTVYFTVNTTATLGAPLVATALIGTDAIADHDTSFVEIVGSYDPNDKTATPSLSPAQLISGDYIYYTIRFQNTGTAVAENVVITDAMDVKLQYPTLQVLSSSHLCKTSVKSNKIYFEFIDIMLPDSNANEIKSHGYISFRIKPRTSIPLNTIIPNKASIYFDYNSPIITNTATTTITEPIVVPLTLLSFAVSKAVGLNANLFWQTAYELNVKHYEMELSVDGRTYNHIGTENAKGNSSNNYTRPVAIPADAVLYFRLKMVDNDGRYVYSNIAILKNDKANTGFVLLGNPVKNDLVISLQDESLRNTSASIVNAQGVTVKLILFKNDIENINVAALPAGTYYLVTVMGNRQFVIVR